MNYVMNYVRLYLLEGESLICGDCDEEIHSGYGAFLWDYRENVPTGSAEVKCRKCFEQTQSVDKNIALLEGVLGQ